MVTDNWRNPVRSLLSSTVEYIVNNLPLYANGNIGQIRTLPPNIKNRILKKFTTSSYFWQNVNFKDILSAVVNDNTSQVNLSSATIDDDMLNILSNCRNLKKLYLTRTGKNQITSTGLINLFKHTTQLYFLVLTNCEQVGDSVLECLSEHCPNLMGLDIGGCKNVTDVGVISLSKLKKLTWLTLSQTQVNAVGTVIYEISDDGISSLVIGNGGRNIKELRIDNCANITEVGLKTIADNCPNIEILMFYNCSNNRDQTISTFQEGNFKNLKQLTWTITWGPSGFLK